MGAAQGAPGRQTTGVADGRTARFNHLIFDVAFASIFEPTWPQLDPQHAPKIALRIDLFANIVLSIIFNRFCYDFRPS